MEESTSLKKEIKEWERAFRAKHGRDPSLDEIKQQPGLADKYKRYKKLSKDASNKPKSRPLLSPTRPAASSTQALPGYNPFSPQKNKGKQKEVDFRLPALHPDPFSESLDPTPIVRARKRLRGEPVSPSPNKGKRRRVAQDSDDEEESAAANSSFVDDSPAKPPTGVRSFKLLFDEKATKPLFPSLRTGTLLSSPVRKISLLPHDAMDIDNADNPEDNPFLSLEDDKMTDDQPPPPPTILLPPSPPPTRNSGQSQNTKPRTKSSADGLKNLGKLVPSDDESDEEEQKVRVFSRIASRRVDDFDEDGYLRARRPPEPILPAAETETTSISLPDNLREILSLAPTSSRTREDKLVVEQLIYGAHRSNYDPAKGGEVWGVGEFEGEQIDDLGPRMAERDEDNEDDWEGEGVPWEVGEM